jgi:hypothetical protein
MGPPWRPAPSLYAVEAQNLVPADSLAELLTHLLGELRGVLHRGPVVGRGLAGDLRFLKRC